MRTQETAERAPIAMSAATRVRTGLRARRNWVQLGRFCAVGASGYAVNLAVFSLAMHALDAHHLTAATLAFLVAVTNNFVWDRAWTFGSPDGRRRFQALRFLVVSVCAFGAGAAMLELLVSSAGVAALPAQAVAIICATPLSFLGNKLWSFRAG